MVKEETDAQLGRDTEASSGCFIAKNRCLAYWLKRLMEFCNYLSGYSEEVDTYISQVIEESIEKKYNKYIRIVCWLNIVLCTLTVILSYPDLSDINQETKWQTCFNCIVFCLIMAAALVTLRVKPIYVCYFVPIMIGICIYLVTQITIQKSYYRLSEYHICIGAMCHTLMILVPTQWKPSLVIHNLCMVHLAYSIWKTYNFMNADVISSTVFSCLWYTISSYLLIIKTRNMYSEILKNKRLINEMKKVMQFLPFGVVIWPSKENEKWFANKEFTNKFTKIRKDLDELKDIDISFLSNSEENKDCCSIQNNLEGLLKAHQKLLDGKDSMTEQDIKIHCHSQGNIFLQDSNQNENERICNIKTLMVEWEGESSYMHVFIDNTDLIKLEEAKNNIKCQKIMFTSASHEFRTPLNSIINSFDIIRNSFNELNDISGPYFRQLRGREKEDLDISTEMIDKFIKIGKNSSLLLLTLIEDILNLSKIEAGTFMISKEVFKISDILNEIYNIFSMQCEQKNIKLIVKTTGDVRHLNIFSDKSRVKQILMNLMSNSMKFTFKGSITIECRTTKHSGKEFVKISVVDTGVGIKKKDQAKLFKLFGMLSSTKDINKNGTGIGLTISKKYVKAIGGNIHLKSAPKIGTDVTFTVPIDRISESENNPKSNRSIWSFFENEIEIEEEGIINQNLFFDHDIGSRGCFTRR
ncbi:unnamed protein product [Moneuplotes crassus]|uniref:Histidine kinase domain-containing protein n=1 Tax=Euplotes crassus TaxID=5936 RepID=A0AAD1Y004_EUPCR|nr:unnamed protein product [Moneuplotes crassus]